MADLEQILSALSSPTRREILWLAWQEELSAGDIAASFDVAAPTISQHLKVLREAGLVSMTVDGNFRRYRSRRDLLAAFEPFLRDDEDRWILPPSTRPAGDDVRTDTVHLVRASVTLPLSPNRAFAHCVEAEHLEHWSGQEAISDPRLGGTFGFISAGFTVRGVYTRFHPPSMLAMQWGFAADGQVPLPDDSVETSVYLSAAETGTTIEIRQPAANTIEADFMAGAWADRLTILREYVDSAQS